MTIPLPLLVPAIRLDHDDADDEAKRALASAREPWVAGYCLFGGEAGQVRDLLGRLREIADRPLFVASEQLFNQSAV